MSPILMPFTFRNGHALRNRIVLVPMTNSMSGEDGQFGSDEFRWLEQRARGGFGSIITAATHVTPIGKGWSRQFGIYSGDHIPGLRPVADMLSANGTVGIVQLHHGGARSPSALTGSRPISASEFQLALPRYETPREMSEVEIYDVIGSCPEWWCRLSVAELTGRALTDGAVAAGQLRGWSSEIFG